MTAIATVISTATCTAYAGAVADTGERLSPAGVAERVGWMSALAQDMTRRLVADHWNAESLAVLAAGKSTDGRALPANGWMVLRRLAWLSTAPVGVYVSDRVRRIAEEHAARLLRLAVHREAILQAVVQTWPDKPAKRTADEWDAVFAAAPAGTTKVEVRARTRNLVTFESEHGRLPVTVTEAETAPFSSGQVLLAAADRQQVKVETDPLKPGIFVVHLLAPRVERPMSRRDWEWIVLPVRAPANVPAHAVVKTPTLRVVGGRVRVDLPYTMPAPAVRPRGHKRALGVDWGYNTLMTAVAGKSGVDKRSRVRVTTGGRPLTFDAAGVSAKLIRLRTVRERVRTRLDHYDRLLARRADATLQAKRDTLAVEHERVCARIRNLNQRLAWAAAGWTVDHAVAAHATAIYIEDLATMQTRGLGRTMNRRLGAHVRGQVFTALRHLAAKAGIAVITVPARGTSAGCPKCGQALRHVKSSDRLTTRSHKWAYCPSCRLSCDRDHAAAERILARGLLGQAGTRKTPSGDLQIVKTADGPVRRLPPGKNRPTPKTSSRLPLRRSVPTPASAGQRPVGRTPQSPLPSGYQVPTTKPNTRPHSPRGGPLGRGFHLHVTATAVRRPVPRPSLS